MHRHACLYVFLAIALLVVGCSSSQSPTVANPFTTADRVPPPTMLSSPAVAPAAPFNAMPAPSLSAAPSFSAAPAYTPGAAAPSPYTSASPYGAAPTAAAPAYGSPPSTYAPAAPAPGTATPYYGASASARAAAPGDTIAVPTDSGSLRFATVSDTAHAKQQPQPVPRAGTQQQRPAATASGWIAGSAPVRTDTLAGSPRVRVPGESLGYESVSLAAINQPQGVTIAPLEPAPTGSRPGDPAPLRVATPPSSTGWR